MMALSAGPLAWLLPLGILVCALALGPLPIVVRGYLRRWLGPQSVRRWFRSVSIGLAGGMIGAVLVAAQIDHDIALGAAVLCLLVLLASIDWQWRWLPIEWTLSLIALGLLFVAQSPAPTFGIVQILVPSLSLLVLRQGLLWSTGKEAMGLGDIWLVAGLGAFLLPVQSFLLLGFAALSGLLEVGLRRLGPADVTQKAGVSFGTHLCIIFVMIRNLPLLG